MLRWADVDLGKAALTVADARTLMGNKTVVEKGTKSLAGERRLPLPDLVREALKCFENNQLAEKLVARERYDDSGYAVVDELGRALDGRQLRERAYRVMDEHGLRRARLYGARASCFTYLANNGVPDRLLPMGRAHRRQDHEALVCEAGCGGSSSGGGCMGRSGVRPRPRSRRECEMWEREIMKERTSKPSNTALTGQKTPRS